MARLVVINQSLNGLAHELGEAWTTIGRGDGNMIIMRRGLVLSFRWGASSLQ